MKVNVAVFFGCCSVEHEVSIISAVQAMHSINKEKYNIIPVYVTKDGEMVSGDMLFDIEAYKNLPVIIKKSKPVYLTRENSEVYMYTKGALSKKTRIDVAFPIVHGTNCEDGTLAGYFEFLRLPYVGPDIISSAVAMDKSVFKDVLARAGLPVLPAITFFAKEYFEERELLLDRIEKEIGYPIIVKPVNLGSSVGITKADNRAALADAVSLAASFSDKILCERAVKKLREINCSVVGDYEECEASPLEEPIMSDEILSFKDKYLGGAKGSSKSGGKGMSSLSRKLPADLSEEKTAEIRDLSCKIFKALGCSGIARIDYILDGEDNERVYANEINSIPGSLAFYLWEAAGLPYTELLTKAIDLAFKRSRKRENLNFTFESNILSAATSALSGSKGTKNGKF